MLKKEKEKLLKKVRDRIIFLRDFGYNISDESIKKYGYTKSEWNNRFFGYVTKEKLSGEFKVKQGDISHCLQLLNLEGLVAQPIKRQHEDGWCPDIYYVNDCKREEKEEIEVKIFDEYKTCPICDEELILSKYDISTKLCNNKCFKHKTYFANDMISIFNKKFDFAKNDSKGLIDRLKNDLKKEIKYWRKDFRYVIKILEESD